MRHQILQFTDYAETLLRIGAAGIVHSVYRKTVNLSLGGRLLALQAAGSPLSPISLITALSEAEMSGLELEAGQRVHVAADGLRGGLLIEIGQHGFSLAGAARFSLRLNGSAQNRLAPAQLDRLREHIAQAASRAEVGGFLNALRLLGEIDGSRGEETSPILSAARDRLETAGSLMQSQRWPEAAGTLARLIGLGSGLTPSGDDFLCGVLAGVRLCGLQAHPFARALHRAVQAHAGDTNDISRAFLNCALEGYFSQAVVRLRGVPACEEILRAFLAIGHSSGMDSLCGTLFTLDRRGLFE